MQEELCWWIFTSFKRERLGNERISGTDKGCRKQHAKQSEMHHCIALVIVVWYSGSSETFRAS